MKDTKLSHHNNIDTPYSILLATYNGANYIEDFLSSCPWPSHADLMVSDDGSSDDTLQKIKNFTTRQNVSVTILQGPCLGAKDNFANLLTHLKKPYFFFADQDDIWEQEKIPTMVKAMQKLEATYGQETPLLVYSDASLIDAHGKELHNSFYKSSFLPQKWNEDFRHTIVMPHVPGCTMLGNKALAQASTPMAHEAVMHDAWVLQVAGALGKVHEIEAPLIRYRQHSANVLGANTLTWQNTMKRIANGRKPKYEAIVRSQRQAAALLKHCGDLMKHDTVKMCTAWAEAEHKSWIGRRIVYAKHGFRKAGWVHNAVLWTCG